MQLDPTQLSLAYSRCVAWLNGVDKGAKRKTFLLHLLAVNAVNLLIIFIAAAVTLQLAGVL